MPEIAKNIKLLLGACLISVNASFNKKAFVVIIAKTTIVRMLKATSLLKFFMPYFAITEVSPAKSIEMTANIFHFFNSRF